MGTIEDYFKQTLQMYEQCYKDVSFEDIRALKNTFNQIVSQEEVEAPKFSIYNINTKSIEGIYLIAALNKIYNMENHSQTKDIIHRDEILNDLKTEAEFIQKDVDITQINKSYNTAYTQSNIIDCGQGNITDEAMTMASESDALFYFINKGEKWYLLG